MSMKKLIRKTFWLISLPLVLISTLLCLSKGINPLDSTTFMLSLCTLIPMMVIKLEESQDNTVSNLILEFQQMEATEFLNFMDEFRKMPLGKMRAFYKEAYRQEYLRRYNKDIFHSIPSFLS